MAYTKVFAIRARLDDRVKYAVNGEKTELDERIVYTADPEKTDTVRFVTTLNCRPAETAFAAMQKTKKKYKKMGGVLGYHFIQSFVPGEVTPEQAHEIGCEFARRLFGEDFEVVIGTHLDKAHPHNHIIVNSVSRTDGHKYHSSPESYYNDVRGTSDALCRENDLSVITPQGKGKHYAEWKAEQGGKPTVRGVIRADIEPRATEHIQEMLNLTERLIADGKAYATPSGDVYFRVRSFPGYGKLSGRTPDDLRSGARVVPGDEKEDPLDFALWKSAKPGEPYWESPWGKGRPGWHIECSAMSEKYIPLPLDIHGGGLDLIFPHHENEIAQTEAALGKPLANIWMHNGFVQVDSEKMSKSLGNFKTIRDILESYLAETLRYFLAGKHYRSPIDFSLDNMDESERSQKRVYECLREVDKALARENWKPGAAPAELVEELKQQDQSFMDALEDDVNTAAAMGHLFNMVRIAGRVLEDKKLRNSEGGRDILRAFRDATAKWDTLLGLFAQKPEGFLASLREIRARRRGLDMNKVAGLLRERQEARAAKDFARSDAARDELAALGVEVRDTPEGPVWDII